MKLPAVTLPPREAIKRRHAPKKAEWEGGYHAYLPCLRWEFGFTCAFCLLHERDFAPEGATRLGVFTIEHMIPQKIYSKAKNDYRNCFYACRYLLTTILRQGQEQAAWKRFQRISAKLEVLGQSLFVES